MQAKIKLPSHIQKSCDEVVYAFHAGKEIPEGLKQIQAWLEDEGWDDLIADLGDQMVLLLGYVASNFMDNELRSSVDIPDDAPVTDEDRIRWGRDQIAHEMRGDDEYTLRGLHAYTLEASDGSTAVLGCIVAWVGMHEIFFDWCGIWRTKDDLYNSFRGDVYYWVWPYMGEVPDDVILSLWQERETFQYASKSE